MGNILHFRRKSESLNIHEEYSIEPYHNSCGIVRNEDDITHANLVYSINTVVDISEDIYNKKITEIFNEILDTEIDY
ncbi:hypothetical protein [Pectobacterium parmentieri]|uniref:hypothetical protein n=1 Tax=Pectobacterium parmentieri TaxID=1905730 RepID=UPI0013C50A0F|nr:hypothetical protein [Pectobacterium parmentieri]